MKKAIFLSYSSSQSETASRIELPLKPMPCLKRRWREIGRLFSNPESVMMDQIYKKGDWVSREF